VAVPPFPPCKIARHIAGNVPGHSSGQHALKNRPAYCWQCSSPFCRPRGLPKSLGILLARFLAILPAKRPPKIARHIAGKVPRHSAGQEAPQNRPACCSQGSRPFFQPMCPPKLLRILLAIFPAILPTNMPTKIGRHTVGNVPGHSFSQGAPQNCCACCWCYFRPFFLPTCPLKSSGKFLGIFSSVI
jgi:hypothetical protein